MKKMIRKINSSAILGADEEKNEEFLDLMRDIKDDFDFILSGLEKLERSDKSDSEVALNIAQGFYDSMQSVIASISERF